MKAFTNELFEAVRYGKNINTVVSIALRYARWRALFTVFIVTFLFGALFFIIWQGALMVSNGTMTAGRLIEFVVYTGIIGGAIAGLGNFYTEIIGAIGATERIREILGEEPEINLQDAEKLEKVHLKGHIVYENAHFSYPTRKDVPVLKGLNFEVQPGSKVALVGTSGAGKSTIVQLLLKFYQLDDGDILIDGQSLSTYNTTAFRKN